MTKIAHMRENRKNNKGFSLVELIIVMAIMVALVAVLAPQYIRYLQRSRDAVVTNAAEDVLTAVKTDFIDPQGRLSLDVGETGTVIVHPENNDGAIQLTVSSNITLKEAAADETAQGYIGTLVGLDSSRQVRSSVSKTITIDYDGTNFDFSIDDTQ